MSGEYDYKKLAQEGASLEGEAALGGFQRLTEDAECLGALKWALDFMLDEQGRHRVKGKARVGVKLVCQACLEAYETEVACDIDTVIVEDEAAFAQLRQQDDGLLVSGKLVTAADLFEDELLLALPMVPRHEEGACPRQESYAQQPPLDEGKSRPFASLKQQLAAKSD